MIMKFTSNFFGTLKFTGNMLSEIFIKSQIKIINVNMDYKFMGIDKF